MLQEYLENLAISGVLTAVKLGIKDEKKKASLKKALLKIYNAIKMLYADDSDFD